MVHKAVGEVEKDKSDSGQEVSEELALFETLTGCVSKYTTAARQVVLKEMSETPQFTSPHSRQS